MQFKIKLKSEPIQTSNFSDIAHRHDVDSCLKRLEALGFIDGAIIQYIRKISGTHILRQGQAVIALSEFEFSHLELQEWAGA